MYGLPSRSAKPGDSVVRGRLRGASAEGERSSSQNICARLPRQKPRSGMIGDDCSQPPLGVALNMLPSRSMMRSEEHTSELQSLMRISYAVFCLKKKNTAN